MYSFLLLSPRSRRLLNENGITTPTMNKNNGIIRSSNTKPSHSTCLSWFIRKAVVGLFSALCRLSKMYQPPIIQNISNPRSASMDVTRPASGFLGSWAVISSSCKSVICIPAEQRFPSFLHTTNARDWSRTSTSRSSLAPQASASAYSATRAS
jgi:hypothetical protein